MSDYKVSELAKKLNVSEQKVRQMISAGSVKSYKIGQRGTRIPENEVKRICGG